MVRILHLEDSADDSELVRHLLQSQGLACELHRVDTSPEYVAALEKGDFDLILSDYSLPGFDGFSALAKAAEKRPEAPFIFVSGTIGEEHAIESLKKGATDYVLKQRLSRLVPAVRRALNEKAERAAREQAEKALREREETFRQILENLREVFYMASPDLSRMLYVNPAYESVWGRPRESIYTQAESRMDAIHPEDHDRVVAALAQSQRSTTIFDEVFRIVRPDGSLRWIRDQAFPVRDESGEIRGIAGFAEDITEHRLAEDRIREQATFLDKASDAILVRDLLGRIRFWNKGAEALYGWTAAEIQGRSSFEVLLEDAPEVRAAQSAVVERGEWSGELVRRRKSGEEIVVDSRWTLVRDEHGAPLSVLAIDSDLTEKKRLQRQVLRAQRMDSLGTLAGGIAHDLNNVLAPIVMAAQVLKRKLPDERSQRMVAAIELGTERAANMVKQILTFARGAEGQRVVLEPRIIVQDIRKIIEETFPKTIRIKEEMARDLWNVAGDPTQLHQVLLNLCLNARDAMPQGGVLTLRAENADIDSQYAGMNPDAKPGPHVVVTVMDTGSGIPVALKERVFEPFFTTKETGKGTGLGLSTSISIVKGHGGFVHLYSEEGRGTTFKVHVPAITAAAARDAEPKPAPPLGSGELLLVVDDEAAIRELTKETLESYGYRVLTAADGAEAVAVFAREHGSVDAVVTDMSMPLMDGPSAIRALRKMDPRIKIITMSGLVPGVAESERTEGADAYLLKPFTADALLTTLRTVLRGTREV